MKHTVKLLGIIALVAVIVFSMAACDNDPEPKTFTVSLDKVDSRSFTVTLEGGSWTDSSLFYILEYSLLSDVGNYTQQNTNSYNFKISNRTSSVVTYSLNDDRSNLKGTIELKSQLDFLVWKDHIEGIVKGDKVVRMSGKGSITF